ncbi:hypothetical protein HXX76_000023 [Chlamydomonas incerta]|uniref:Uncharacterized protein n=1 Tax=Chlamydomonas incerta TaxID=51695 RepID=A0A836B237_CHLIN|nr:hypothetical protein HXX76_000023 [Chlamydomonas incerta]|eukprot:KAG2445401.1 hypothetical protein HXX76_000023 [Chlamydomonas incerta]
MPSLGVSSSASVGRPGGGGSGSSSSGPGLGGGGPPSLRQYHSPLRRWVWAAVCTNLVWAGVFAGLCAASYRGFNAAVTQLSAAKDASDRAAAAGAGDEAAAAAAEQASGLPPGTKASDWQALFAAAAISAAFAVALTILFHACALALLLCSFKSLADPHRRFGRGFVAAAALCVGMHTLNIALQFNGYGPTLATWRHRLAAGAFQPALLTATMAFGWLSFINYTALAVLLFFWNDPVDVYLLDRSPAGVM